MAQPSKFWYYVLFFLLCNFILEIRYFHLEHYVVEVFIYLFMLIVTSTCEKGILQLHLL